jgi:hypothetical protein
VRNTGDTTLTDVTLADALFPSCNATIGTLTAGQTVTLPACTGVAPADDVTNTAIATGTAPDTSPVTGSGSFTPRRHPSVH